MAKKKISKQKILARLTEVPDKQKRVFYAREMKFLNTLCERYSLEFMDIVSFTKKFDSLAYLVSPKLKETLDRKFRAFNYKFDKDLYPSYTLGEKSGENKEVTRKPKTIRDFLNE